MRGKPGEALSSRQHRVKEKTQKEHLKLSYIMSFWLITEADTLLSFSWDISLNNCVAVTMEGGEVSKFENTGAESLQKLVFSLNTLK